MAIRIPDSCPSKATVGEERVHALLRDALPDHFTAWYEPRVGDRYPDFTVMAADFGLLVREVKGWYIDQITRANDRRVVRHRTVAGQVLMEDHPHPNRQAREYLFALLDRRNRPEFAILRQADGEHRGKPCFPCGYGALLTTITRAQLDEGGLTPVFPPDGSSAAMGWRCWRRPAIARSSAISSGSSRPGSGPTR